MKTWEIRLNGQPFSCFYTALRSNKHEQKIIDMWKEGFARLGYLIPEGKLTANVYLSTALDRYGN